MLERHGIQGRQLDISEAVLTRDAEKAAAVLYCLQGMGIDVAIDDFDRILFPQSARSPCPGAEDRSVVREQPAREAAEVGVARTIVELAKILEVEVIAEGIENGGVPAMRQAGCTGPRDSTSPGPVGAAKAEATIRDGYHLTSRRRRAGTADATGVKKTVSGGAVVGALTRDPDQAAGLRRACARIGARFAAATAWTEPTTNAARITVGTTAPRPLNPGTALFAESLRAIMHPYLNLRYETVATALSWQRQERHRRETTRQRLPCDGPPLNPRPPQLNSTPCASGSSVLQFTASVSDRACTPSTSQSPTPDLPSSDSTHRPAGADVHVRDPAVASPVREKVLGLAYCR